MHALARALPPSRPAQWIALSSSCRMLAWITDRGGCVVQQLLADQMAQALVAEEEDLNHPANH